MKIICKAQDLYSALNCCMLSHKPSKMPILQNALINSQDNSFITITGTNLEIAIKTRIAAKIQSDGNILLPLKPALRYLKREKENVILESSKESILLYTPNPQPDSELEISILGQSSADFPAIPQIESVYEYFAPDSLKHMLNIAKDFTSPDESRPVLTSILFESKQGQLSLIAADGFRMCIVKTETKLPDGEFCLPASTVSYVTRFLAGSIKLQYDKNHIVFNDSTHTLTSQLTQGTFPRYQQLIPTALPLMTAKCSGVLMQHRCEQSAAKIMRIYKNDTGLKLKMSSSTDYATDISDTYQATLQAEITGEGKVACDRSYMQRLSRWFAEINMEITTPSSPIKITNEDGSLIVVIMPFFVQW